MLSSRWFSPVLLVTIVILLLVLIVSLVIVLPSAKRRAGQAGPERFGMSEEQYREFSASAQRFGMSPEGLKNWIDQTIGTPLLYDRKRKLVVSWQASADGSAKTIHIVPVPNPAGPDPAQIRYELGEDEGESMVVYSGSLLPSDNPRGAFWRDLNADGVFDQLLIAPERNELLKLDRGMHVLLDGRWARAERGEKMPPDTVMVGGTLYRFDGTAGRWLPEQEPQRQD